MQMQRRSTPFLAVALAAAITACGNDTTGPEPVSIEETNFAASLGIDLASMEKTDAGTYFQDLVVGDSTEAVAGATVDVHYLVWLSDGTLIQDSHDLQTEPFQFLLTNEPGGVIAGWVDGIPGMKIGGTRRLLIPWELAYGSHGSGPIPAYANLLFEVELYGVTLPEVP